MKTVYLFISLLICFAVCSCSDIKKQNTGNTYYLEIGNCKDSLKNFLVQNLSGKVSYFKNNKVQVLSVNYLTSDDYPDMHYFKMMDELGKDINEGTHKIKIELAGDYSIDSTSYSITNYAFKISEWVKTSDIGFTKASPQNINMYDKTRIFFMWDLGGQIIKAAALSTY